MRIDDLVIPGYAAVIEITLPKGKKRSWDVFRKIAGEVLRSVDLRRASKTHVPLYIKTDCCGYELEVRRKKDFPLKNKKCKCGETYLVKWFTQK